MNRSKVPVLRIDSATRDVDLQGRRGGVNEREGRYMKWLCRLYTMVCQTVNCTSTLR
jgi:hypothetical protein